MYGGPVLDFSASLNPAGMPEAVRRALRESADLCDRYPDPYCRQLRAAISRAENVPAEWVLCGAGASDLIYRYAGALTGDGPVLVTAPAFCEYAEAARACGRRVEVHTLTRENGFRLTGEILERDLTKYSSLFLCSPNNPTGIAVEPELLERIAGTGARVLLDLCFLDLTEDPDRYRIPELTARRPNVTVLRSPTKSFAIPGARLGYAISRDGELLERMSALGQCWDVSVPAQAAGTAAMGCFEWLRRSVAALARERERLAGGLAALGLTVFPGEANFLLICSGKELAGPLRARGIAVRDCANFEGLGPGYIRVAVRAKDENDRLLEAVREVLS